MERDLFDVRSNFGLNSKVFNTIQSVADEDIFFKEMPVVIEGVELYDAICPVSKLTGKRCNPLSLLGMLTGAKADVLNSILQELPVIASNPNLSDEDRAQFVVEHASTGSPAEDALLAKRIMADLDALGLKPKDVNAPVSSDGKIIEFDNDDANTKED